MARSDWYGHGILEILKVPFHAQHAAAAKMSRDANFS